MATEDTIQNLIRVTRLYFRALRWRVQNDYDKNDAKTTFCMNSKELLALGISTVEELRLFEEIDEGCWTEHISNVLWNRKKFGEEGVCYRDDLQKKKEKGDLEPIPDKAEVDMILFKTPGPIPVISIVGKLQELRLAIERNVLENTLNTCKWEGLPLFEQCKDDNQVIDFIKSTGQKPEDVLEKMFHVQKKYLICFRMLKRMITPKPPAAIETKPALTADLPDTEQSVETKKGNVWTFIFLGETVSVNGSLKGLKLLEVLLTNPDKYYNPLDLLKEAGLESQGTTASELIYEQKDRRAISKNIGELEIAYDEEQDPAEKMEIKEKIEKARKILSNAINKYGKSRCMSDRYRIRVSSLIKKVLSKIAHNSPNLHNHFKAFLKFGMENTYKPDKKIVWSIK